ncbi:MAG: hypothetical protein JWN69_2522 [Alphaproteobacteria bacterium]|nr:hypothetical protein [Alphaproteobacteria bacterium]
MADRKWPSWPAWHYGPHGAAATFERAEDVPAGWADAPAKVAHRRVHDPDGTKRASFGRKRKAIG